MNNGPEYPQWTSNEIERLRAGYFSDQYFNRVAAVGRRYFPQRRALMQIFQKREAILCGIPEVLDLLKKVPAHPETLQIATLPEGSAIFPEEPVLTIEGPYVDFAPLETIYLGLLARRTKIATNVHRAVTAAGRKPVLFFAARDDDFRVQEGDGYAAKVGGAAACATNASAIWWHQPGVGTMSHSFIALCDGDIVLACQRFHEMFPEQDLIALVDYHNDCVTDALKAADAMGPALKGVRLDTSETMVDRSLWEKLGRFNPTGVNVPLVENVRSALDKHGYHQVQIMVSGGFTPEKIAAFEKASAPVDTYAIGEFFMSGQYTFTADIVEVDGRPQSKAGRKRIPSTRLHPVEL
ncbi:MAG: nicotinate phosphoribosyltransferase [Firmicutes bacterium]|nr:nicotinate phosphoribosyltransferase [Bacillota bacterium]